LAVYWAGFARQTLRAVGPSPYLWIRIPLGRFLDWRLPLRFKQAVLAGRVLVDAAGDREALDTALFRSWVKETNSREGGVCAWTFLEIEARLGRFADATLATSAGDPSPQAILSEREAAAAARIAVFLSQHFAEPIYWKELAQVAGLSVTCARKCFQHTYGVTLHQYLLQLRLAQAKRLIAGAHAKIIDIAMETGFPTVSNFYRSFEAEVGQTPSAYRKSVQAMVGPSKVISNSAHGNSHLCQPAVARSARGGYSVPT
jgi:AraC-like DNA-binding protein